MLSRGLWALVLVSSLACLGNGSPRLVSWELLGGEPDSTGSTRVAVEADGSIRLRKDRVYPVRVTVHTPVRRDRCIYRVVSCSWFVQGRVFNCSTEASETAKWNAFRRTHSPSA